MAVGHSTTTVCFPEDSFLVYDIVGLPVAKACPCRMCTVNVLKKLPATTLYHIQPLMMCAVLAGSALHLGVHAASTTVSNQIFFGQED